MNDCFENLGRMSCVESMLQGLVWRYLSDGYREVDFSYKQCRINSSSVDDCANHTLMRAICYLKRPHVNLCIDQTIHLNGQVVDYFAFDRGNKLKNSHYS